MDLTELKTVWHLLRGVGADGPLAERLDRFYRPQAGSYDRFRARLLAGRGALIAQLGAHLPDGARVVELGAGTGSNATLWGARLPALHSLELVDLCPSLLEQARLRCRPLANARVIEADAVAYRPAEPVDCVYFSYSLTMMPDWFRALTNALAMLKPGGVLGVVDFYVSRSEVEDGRARHNTLTRWLLPRWFRHDGVRLDPAHLETLETLTDRQFLLEDATRLPYLPGIHAPYYAYVGIKTGAPRAEAVQHLWKTLAAS